MQNDNRLKLTEDFSLPVPPGIKCISVFCSFDGKTLLIDEDQIPNRNFEQIDGLYLILHNYVQYQYDRKCRNLNKSRCERSLGYTGIVQEINIFKNRDSVSIQLNTRHTPKEIFWFLS